MKASGWSEEFANEEIMPHEKVRRLKYFPDPLHLFFYLLSEIMFIINHNVLKFILIYILIYLTLFISDNKER